MIEVQGKIEFLRKMMLGEQHRTTDQQLIDSTERVQRQLDKRKVELKLQEGEYIKHRVAMAEKKSDEQVAMERERARQAERSAKEECLQDLNKSIDRKFLEYAKTEAYQKKLSADIKKVVAENPTAILQVVPRDVEFVKGLVPKTATVEEIEASALGGYLLLNQERTTRENYTIRARLEQKSYETGKKLYRMLDEGKVDHA